MVVVRRAVLVQLVVVREFSSVRGLSCTRGQVFRKWYRSSGTMTRVFRPGQYNCTNVTTHKNPQLVFAACLSAASLASYFRLSVEWFSIPPIVGILFLCVIQFNKTRRREDRELQKLAEHPDVEVDDYLAYIYQCLPLRTVSRVFGYVSEKQLPSPILKGVLNVYCKYFEVDLDEACIDNIESYKTISEFFQRELKPTVRIIDNAKPLISPCDGKVLHYGRCQNGYVEQVKGIKYSVTRFLGGSPTLSDPQHNDIFYTVLYLAPGDYHLFHSPCEWTVNKAIHFPGTLMSVNPFVCRLVRGVFTLNERVMLAGTWEHGFFSYTAVGATGVGSIKINFLKGLQTNKSGFLSSLNDTEVTLDPKEEIKTGDMIGGFNFGSTIVLMFEAPKNFQFTCQNGERVRMGGGLGELRPTLMQLEENISEVIAECSEQIIQTINDVAEQTGQISNEIIKTAVDVLQLDHTENKESSEISNLSNSVSEEHSKQSV